MKELIFLGIFAILIFIIIRLSKGIGESNAIIHNNEKEDKEYEQDKEIINANNNLTRDELLDKLHSLQSKK